MKPLFKRLEEYKKMRHIERTKGKCHVLNVISNRVTHPPLEEQGQKHFDLCGSKCSWTDDRAYPFDHIRYADEEVSYIRHTGWFVDSFQSDTTRGVALRVHRDTWIAAVTDPWNWDSKNREGQLMVIVDSVFDTAEEAAKVADRHAKRWAEECREEDAKHQASLRIEELKDELAENRKERRIINRALHDSMKSGLLKPELLEETRLCLLKCIERRRAHSREAWAKIRKLEKNPFEAVAN